ncbi:NAD(P)H-binding protein [Streptacidiphilus sp. PAMC 29251]
MRTVIAGGHGQIALHLERLLAARGDTPVGLIRRTGQEQDLRDAGAEPVLCDLESATVEQVAEVLAGADAAVFAAGAGASGGAGRTDTVDRAGAVLFADAAVLAGVPRFVLLSSMGADPERPDGTDPGFAAYLRAKGAADAHLAGLEALDRTILRPGSLTDDPAADRVLLAEHTGRGSVPRADVAAVIAALLQAPATSGLTLELIAGDAPVTRAVQDAAAAGSA